jgi:hypothetical protein
VIFLGLPDVGKTHFSLALAEATIRACSGAYFITALLDISLLPFKLRARLCRTDDCARERGIEGDAGRPCPPAPNPSLIAGKITGSVIDWSPEKPRAFGMRPVNGE